MDFSILHDTVLTQIYTSNKILQLTFEQEYCSVPKCFALTLYGVRFLSIKNFWEKNIILSCELRTLKELSDCDCSLLFHEPRDIGKEREKMSGNEKILQIYSSLGAEIICMFEEIQWQQSRELI